MQHACTELMLFCFVWKQPAEKLFEPDRVPVFCRCEMPYNPDQFMVCCDTCTEWWVH